MAAPGLLPGVGEDADAAAEDEQAAREGRGEAELAVDDGGGAVDVHRDGGDRGLHGRARDEEAALGHAVGDGLRDEGDERVAARVARVEAVAEAGQVAVAGAPPGDRGAGRLVAALSLGATAPDGTETFRVVFESIAELLVAAERPLVYLGGGLGSGRGDAAVPGGAPGHPGRALAAAPQVIEAYLGDIVIEEATQRPRPRFRSRT